MVRILKVRELEARKQQLLKRSELYRQTMGVELATIKFAVARLQRKLKMAKSTTLLAAAVAGFFLMRKRGREREQEPQEGGLLAKLRSGIKLVGMSWPVLKGFFGRSSGGSENGEADGAE